MTPSTSRGIVADDLEADIVGQRRDVPRQLDAFAAARGLDRGRVFGATLYVTDMTEKPAMNRVWREFFDPDHLPARALRPARRMTGAHRCGAR